MRLAGPVAPIGKIVLVGKPNGTRPLCRPRQGWNGMDWIHMAQNSEQWQALLNMVINLQVPLGVWNFLSDCWLLSKDSTFWSK
jgi:hypothetical protein